MKFSFLILSSFLLLQCNHSAQSEMLGKEQGSEVVAPEPEAVPRTHYRFAIISDLNGSYGSTKYNADVKKAVEYIADKNNEIHFVISTGDMVAGQKSNLNYKAMWESFHSTVTRPLLKEQIPIFPSPGNHDAYLSRKIEREHYKKSWEKENVLKNFKDFKFVSNVKQNFPFQYAFTIGKALFIALDNTATQPWKDSTVAWLEKVLSQESTASVKMIYGHVPLLPFAFKKEREYVARGSVGFLNDIEALFAKYKVDVFFSGHSHVYYPGRRGESTEYISVPLLGSGTRYLISKQEQPRSKTGFLVIDIDSSGSWTMKHHSAKDFSLFDDKDLPEIIQLPSSNTKLCRYCSQFPKTHFLDPKQRIIYQRRDL